ncbi:hypothetical protein GLOIN_2v1791422 [Rhizophagus irregularis DAOM 181602=DAOM 197198]|uniref:Uncharacterized protein n=2 Tax=Rhizophagus irregularis TaxID=588596 RepID=U9SZR8_RHIID|eukprot:XP_025164572.1 hypothetical protein GLOIN_2v1791422 [Rhizophagus irregularis DAOM 181602=DAOM 197198]
MNISKYHQYSSSRSPERKNYSRHHLSGNQNSRYSHYSSQRDLFPDKNHLPSTRRSHSNIQSSHSPTVQKYMEYDNDHSLSIRNSRRYDNDRSSITRDSREYDKNHSSSFIGSRGYNNDRSSIIRDSRKYDKGHSSSFIGLRSKRYDNSYSSKEYDNVIKALSRAVNSLTEKVQSIKNSQSKPLVDDIFQSTQYN